MGKVVLKIQTHDSASKDGIAVDSVGKVTGTVNMTVPGTKGELYTNQPDRGKNPRFAVEKTVVTLTAPQTVADAGDSKIAIINPAGFTGTSVKVHAVVERDGTNNYGEANIQVIEHGSGYTLTDGAVADADKPDIFLKDKDGVWQELTVAMGSGVLLDTDFDRLTLFEDGRKINHDGIEFFNVKDGALFKDTNNPENEVDFYGKFLKDRPEIVSIKPLNIYNRNIELADLGIQQMATFIGSARMLDQVKKQEKQIAHYNKAANQLIETTTVEGEDIPFRFDGKTYQDYEGLSEGIYEAEVDKFETELGKFQENFRLDLGNRYTIRTRSASSMEPVWTAAMLLISDYAKRYRGVYMAARPDLDRIKSYLAQPRVGGHTLQSAGFPTYPPNPEYPERTFARAGQPIERPKELDYIKAVAKFFYWKTICMAAIGTIGGIFSRIMSSKSGVSTYRRSGGNLEYTARVWMPKDTDTMLVTWLKAEFAKHDLISILRNIIDAVTIGVRGIKDLAKSIFPKDNTEATRMQVLLMEAHCAASIESLKSVFKNLNAYREAAYKDLEHLINEGAFNEGTFGSSDPHKEARETISNIEYTLGKIELCLDAYAILTDPSNAKEQEINLNETLYWAEIQTGKKGGLALYEDFNKKATGLKGKTVSNFGYAYESRESTPKSILDLQPSDGFTIYGLFKPDKNAYSQNAVLPNFSLIFDADGDAKVLVNNAGSNLGSRILLRGSFNTLDLSKLAAGSSINDMVYRFNHKEEPTPNRTQAKKERDTQSFAKVVNDAKLRADGVDELKNLNSNFEALARFINNHGIGTLQEFLDGTPTTSPFASSRTRRARNTPQGKFASNWKGAVETLSKIEATLRKKAKSEGRDPESLVGDMMVVSLIKPELGRCEDESIKVWDKNHAKVFFESPNAYNSTRKKSIIHESICKKTSCGVAQVYVTPPSIGEKTKVDTSGAIPTVVPDGVQTGAICGNVTLKYNLHPTTDLLVIGHQQNFALFTDSQTIDKGLRIPSSNPQGQSTLLNSGLPTEVKNRIKYGTNGDISMPAVFGNWAFSFNNPKENDKRNGLIKFLQFFSNIAQLSNSKVDPTISKSITEEMRKLLEAYQGHRLYNHEFTKRTNASHSSAVAKSNYEALEDSRLAPAKTSKETNWSKKSAISYYNSHKKNLENAYSDLAQATGKYAWDKSGVNSMDITPVLTTEQKFSGLCYPVFQSFGYDFKGYRTTLGAPISLGAWGPTTNNKQQEEEMFLGRGGDKSINGRIAADGLIAVESAHLPSGTLSLNNVEKQKDSSQTPEGIKANTKIYIPDRPFMRELFEKGMAELETYSTWMPRFEVRDISPKFKIIKSGLPVGADSFTIGSGNITGKTLKEIEAVCMNVTGYEKEAGDAHRKGYWKNNGFAEPWDSRKLKEKYGIPYYNLNSANGKSYISGQTGDSEATAVANLVEAVSGYHEWVNNRHYTGAALIKNGARITGDTVHEATGYDDDTTVEAEANAFTTLASNLGSAWTTALSKTGEDGNKLAVSGLKSTDTIISSYTHNIATHAGTWSPVTPTKYAENLPALKITGGGGASNLATATADYLNKLRGKPNGSVRTVPLCGDGDTGPDARPNPTHLSSGLVPFQTSYSAVSNTSCADAFNTLKILVDSYSNTYYNLYGEGLAAGSTNFLTLTSSGCSGIGTPTITNPLSTGWSTAGNLADAKNGGSNTNSWYARLSCSAGTLGTGDGSQVLELGMSGNAVVNWPTQFTATGSTTGQAWTRTKLQQIGVDNHQLSYWTTALSKTNADIELVGGTPGLVGNFTLFQTGAPTFTSGSGIVPMALTAPPAAGKPFAQNYAYHAALGGAGAPIGSSGMCESDSTSTNCSFGSGASDNELMALHNECGGTTDCELAIVEDGSSGATNWLSVISGIRHNIYKTIRRRLQLSEYDTSTTSCSAVATGTYGGTDLTRFTGAGADLAVYPNTGALCHIEDNNADISWDTNRINCSTPSYWHTGRALGYAAAQNEMTGEAMGLVSDVDPMVINLKEWAPDGDVDIYILEKVTWFNDIIDAGECYFGGGPDDSRVGDIRRTIESYNYETAIIAPVSMSNVSGSFYTGEGGGSSTVTAVAPVINRTRFVKGTGVCTDYDQFRATGDASAPNFITGEARCENWNTNVKQAIVTGRIDSAVSVAITPLARNEYDGTIVVSGEVPVVTGKCNWSSNKRPIFKDDSELDPTTKLPKQTLSGYVDQSEAYILHYQNNYSGVYKPETTAGKSASTVRANKNAQGTQEFASDQEHDKLTKAVEAGDTYKRSDRFLVQASVPDKDPVPSYLVGGWERVNQAASVDSVTSVDGTTNFGEHFIITVDNKKAEAVLKAVKKEKNTRKALFGKDISPDSITIGSPKVAQKALDSKINNVNLKSRKMGLITVSLKEANNIAQGKKLYVVEINAEGLIRKTQVLSDKGPDEAISLPIQIIENEAAACQSCVTTEVSADKSTMEKEVVYMHENYIHAMQLDWELRSGDWLFTVPYMTAGKTVKYNDNGTEKEFVTQNWYEIVTDSFQNEAADKYENHYTLYGIPYNGQDTQNTCDLNEFQSKLDKIYDYQIELNQKGATYRHLKEAGKHEIKFKT